MMRLSLTFGTRCVNRSITYCVSITTCGINRPMSLDIDIYQDVPSLLIEEYSVCLILFTTQMSQLFFHYLQW